MPAGSEGRSGEECDEDAQSSRSSRSWTWRRVWPVRRRPADQHCDRPRFRGRLPRRLHVHLRPGVFGISRPTHGHRACRDRSADINSNNDGSGRPAAGRRTSIDSVKPTPFANDAAHPSRVGRGSGRRNAREVRRGPRQAPAPMSATDRSILADHSCVIRQLARLRGVGLMVVGDDPAGRVRRISIVAGSDIRTDAGIGLGSSLQAVRAAYGHGLDEPFDHFPVDGDAVLVRADANRYLSLHRDSPGTSWSNLAGVLPPEVLLTPRRLRMTRSARTHPVHRSQ